MVGPHGNELFADASEDVLDPRPDRSAPESAPMKFGAVISDPVEFIPEPGLFKSLLVGTQGIGAEIILSDGFQQRLCSQ